MGSIETQKMKIRCEIPIKEKHLKQQKIKKLFLF